ncbi:MAG TPA: hypothetical protein VIH57_19615 [Bacteroidales bacterium]
MKQCGIIYVFAVLITIHSCTKDKHITEQIDFCGTVANTEWTHSLTKDSLIGNWVICHVDYSKGIGMSTLVDTSYNLSAKLVLNIDGTGTLNSSPLKWSLTTKINYMPILTFTNIDTINPFPVNIIHGDSLVTYIQLPPKSRFFVIAGQGGGGQWEESYISFERQ